MNIIKFVERFLGPPGTPWDRCEVNIFFTYFYQNRVNRHFWRNFGKYSTIFWFRHFCVVLRGLNSNLAAILIIIVSMNHPIILSEFPLYTSSLALQVPCVSIYLFSLGLPQILLLKVLLLVGNKVYLLTSKICFIMRC